MSDLLGVQFFAGGSIFGATVAFACIYLAMKLLMFFGDDDQPKGED